MASKWDLVMISAFLVGLCTYERLISLSVLRVEGSKRTWFHFKPSEACLSFKAARYESRVEGLMDLCIAAMYVNR